MNISPVFRTSLQSSRRTSSSSAPTNPTPVEESPHEIATRLRTAIAALKSMREELGDLVGADVSVRRRPISLGSSSTGAAQAGALTVVGTNPGFSPSVLVDPEVQLGGRYTVSFRRSGLDLVNGAWESQHHRQSAKVSVTRDGIEVANNDLPNGLSNGHRLTLDAGLELELSGTGAAVIDKNASITFAVEAAGAGENDFTTPMSLVPELAEIQEGDVEVGGRTYRIDPRSQSLQDVIDAFKTDGIDVAWNPVSGRLDLGGANGRDAGSNLVSLLVAEAPARSRSRSVRRREAASAIAAAGEATTELGGRAMRATLRGLRARVRNVLDVESGRDQVDVSGVRFNFSDAGPMIEVSDPAQLVRLGRRSGSADVRALLGSGSEPGAIDALIDGLSDALRSHQRKHRGLGLLLYRSA